MLFTSQEETFPDNNFSDTDEDENELEGRAYGAYG